MKIRNGRITISAICAGHGSCDRLTDHFRRQHPNQVLIGFDIPNGYCVNTVAISRGMNRVDGTGISVVSHPGNFTKLRFLEMGVCENDTDAYLLRVLSLLPYLGKMPANAELDELLPWHPGMQAYLRRTDNMF